MTKKIILSLLVSSLFFLNCNSEKPAGAAAQTTGGESVVKLNTELFKKQVFNYEKSKEWKYEGDKPAIIDFYADWCAQCKELDKYTYTNPEVVELSNRFNNIKVDLTSGNSDITDKFEIKGLPVVVFLNAKGEEIKELRVTGFLKPEEFKNKLNSIK